MCVSLTEHGDVDAGRGGLAFHILLDVADVVSIVGRRGTGEDEAGAHGHGGQDVCQRVHINDLEERGTFE